MKPSMYMYVCSENHPSMSSFWSLFEKQFIFYYLNQHLHFLQMFGMLARVTYHACHIVSTSQIYYGASVPNPGLAEIKSNPM